MYFLKAQVRSSHCNGPQAQGNYCHLVEKDLHSLFPMARTVWYVTAWVPEAAHLGIGTGIEHTPHEKHVCLIAACIPGQ